MTLHQSAHPRETTKVPARRGLVAVVRGLMALLLLAALAVGPPAALVRFVGNPIPDQAVVGGLLTDAAVIGMLAAVVWVAWAQLMLAVAVEILNAARGVKITPRLPLCSPQQHLAHRLVFAISILVIGSSIATSPALADQVSAGTVATASTDPQSSVTGPIAAPMTTSAPRSDRSSTPPPATVPAQGPRPDGLDRLIAMIEPSAEKLWYTVKPPRGQRHDTLWDIAERHLGDGLRWKEIHQLNRGREQADGGRLDEPGLILPGWRLLLPADATGLPKEEPPRDRSRDDETQTEHAKPAEKASAQDQATDVIGGQERVGGPEGGGTETRPGSAAPDAASDAARGTQATPRPAPGAEAFETQGDTITAHEDDPEVPLGTLTLGLAATACLGLVTELARRRTQARRLRRTGQRLVRPAPATLALERRVRAANAELSVTSLRNALRRLAFACYRQGRTLPDVQAIHLKAEGAVLTLGADEPDAVAPFTAAGPRTWTLDAEAANDLRPEDVEDEDPADVYPALVALGVTGDAVVLVNLESAGTLRIGGPDEQARQVLGAVTVELGTSPLADQVMLTLTGAPPALVRLCHGGMTIVDEPERAASAAAANGGLDDVLNSFGCRDLREARTRRCDSDVLWVPQVVIHDRTGRADESIAPPAEAIASLPYRGLSVVTTGQPTPKSGSRASGNGAGDGAQEWTLRPAGGRWRLEPLGIELDPQRLDPSVRDGLDDLLDAAVTATEPATDPETTVPPPSGSTQAASTCRIGPGPAAIPDLPSLALATGMGTRTVARDVQALANGSTADREDTAAAPGRTADAAERPPVPPRAAPRILVLGPVELHGAIEEKRPPRDRRPIELAAYLALHRDVTQPQLDEALWPGAIVLKDTRNPLVTRTRTWLGNAPDGRLYLPHYAEGSVYTLRPEVSSDWQDFQALAARGMAAGPDGTDDLAAALDLVRGRPFLGTDPHAYTWAEIDTQDILVAIVDSAHALAELALTAGDHRLARWAANRALAADPHAELAYQDAIRAATAQGDLDGAKRMMRDLRSRIDEIDPLFSPGDDTSESYREAAEQDRRNRRKPPSP